MKIVIDIPEETFKYYVTLANKGEQIGNLERIILDGKPLPKGHGDLIDRRELKKEVYTTTEWNGDVHRIIYEASVDDAPTIIEGSDSE